MMYIFEILNLNNIKIYLGVKFYYNELRIYFHKNQYIKKFLEQFEIFSYTPISAPMNSMDNL